MADDNNQQNQQKQKGGNQNGSRMGITLGTSVSAVNNPNLGETIRGAVADGLGFTAGAIATGVFSYFINKLIRKFKPSANVPALFPTAEDRAAMGPNPRELMTQLHQLRSSNKEEAQRIVESVGRAMGLPIGQQLAPAQQEQNSTAQQKQPEQEPVKDQNKQQQKKNPKSE